MMSCILLANDDVKVPPPEGTPISFQVFMPDIAPTTNKSERSWKLAAYGAAVGTLSRNRHRTSDDKNSAKKRDFFVLGDRRICLNCL